MKILNQNLLGFTKSCSDRKNMWIIFTAMCGNMVLLLVALLLTTPVFTGFMMTSLGFGSLILAGGLLFWQQLFQNIVAVGIVSSGIKADLNEALNLLQKEKAEIKRQKK